MRTDRLRGRSPRGTSVVSGVVVVLIGPSVRSGLISFQ